MAKVQYMPKEMDKQPAPGAPVIRDVTVTGGSIEIGPFATAGLYHLYCTIHSGMNLAIVVQ